VPNFEYRAKFLKALFIDFKFPSLKAVNL